MSVFHAKDGWMFERMEDGSVRVHLGRSDPPNYRSFLNEKYVEFDPGTWASIVAAVSKAGDNAQSFARAVRLHEDITEHPGYTSPNASQANVATPMTTEPGPGGWDEHR